MAIWLVIPVKPFEEGKTRLAAVLSDVERRSLNRQLLERTIKIGCEAFDPSCVIVVSRSAEALAIARAAGARGVEEAAGGGLNDALAQAASVAREGRASGVLSLSADLPLLGAGDLTAMVAEGSGARVVIAGDTVEQGTNAMLVSPVGAIAYSYGPGSFAEHARLARAAHLMPLIVRRQGLAFDIDTPADLKAWRGRAESD